MKKTLGHDSAAGLRAVYPKFFWSMVAPYSGRCARRPSHDARGQALGRRPLLPGFCRRPCLPTLGAERIRE